MADKQKSVHPLTQFIKNCTQIESLRGRNEKIAAQTGYSVEKLEDLRLRWNEAGRKEPFYSFHEREKHGDKASNEEINDLIRQTPEQWRQTLESDTSRRLLRALGCHSVKEGIFQLRKLSNLKKVVALCDGPAEND